MSTCSNNDKEVRDFLAFYLSSKFVSNKKYAIVGKSGSGKTTLVRLLLGVQSPDEGAIYINQANLSEVDLTSYFSKLYYLPQKTAIFATSIGEDLTLLNHWTKQRP